MPRYAAFLRAVNVGGHVVKMDRLRQLFEETGFTGVSTHLASGNVLFTAGRGRASRLEEKIEKSLEAALGWDVAAFLRTPAEVASVAARQPFPPEAVGEAHGVYVGFLKEPLDTAQLELVNGLRTETDELAVSGREVFWLSRVRVAEASFSSAQLERALGVRTTFRNVNTVRGVAAKLAG